MLDRYQNRTLLIDADDTLWHNNIYFEQATKAFIEFLDHSTLSDEEIQGALDEIEAANVAVHGYGSESYGRNLQECFEALTERKIDPSDVQTVMGFAESILNQDIVLIDGVAETLPELASRHRLVIFTKGHPEEQRMKIDRSGLDTHFVDAIVLAEKDAHAYKAAIFSLDADPLKTWMIGNSPKSDINPALQAGLSAVFIPYERTWSLEQQELVDGIGELLEVSSFRDLLEHF